MRFGVWLSHWECPHGIDEIENPELSMARMQELYEKKG